MLILAPDAIARTYVKNQKCHKYRRLVIMLVVLFINPFCINCIKIILDYLILDWDCIWLPITLVILKKENKRPQKILLSLYLMIITYKISLNHTICIIIKRKRLVISSKSYQIYLSTNFPCSPKVPRPLLATAIKNIPHDSFVCFWVSGRALEEIVLKYKIDRKPFIWD